MGIEAVTPGLERLLATQGSLDPTAMLAANQALTDFATLSASDTTAANATIDTTFADMLANAQTSSAGTGGTAGTSATGAATAAGSMAPTGGAGLTGGTAPTGSTALAGSPALTGSTAVTGGAPITGTTAAVTGGAPITGAASAITPSSSSGESEAGETGATGESGESETNETSAAGESETDVASATTGASAASGITASAGTMATSVAPFVPHGGQYGFFPTSTTNYTHGKEPEIAARLDALGKALHLHLVGLSGYRTPQHSVAVGGYANDPHTRGEAMDTPGVEGVPESVLRRFGLTRPFPGASEADHIQLA